MQGGQPLLLGAVASSLSVAILVVELVCLWVEALGCADVMVRGCAVVVVRGCAAVVVQGCVVGGAAVWVEAAGSSRRVGGERLQGRVRWAGGQQMWVWGPLEAGGAAPACWQRCQG
jgi:hypothetical protein